MWPSRIKFIATCVFLPRGISSAAYALACFNHETTLQGAPSFAASFLGKRIANLKIKEDFAPFTQIGQPQRGTYFTASFLPFSLVKLMYYVN